MFATYSISREALDGVVKRAVASAKRGGREICGVLVTHANVLTPIPLRNKVKRGGSWALYSREVRQAVAIAEKAGGQVVGTFHSHPVGLPEPGPSDIANAQHDSLMLIVDCLDKKWGLWHIDGGEVRRLRLVRRRLTPMERTGCAAHRPVVDSPAKPMTPLTFRGKLTLEDPLPG